MTGANGHFYNGKWLFGKYHGQGYKLWAEGHRYDGEWIHGLREGEGIMVYNTGKINEGDWTKDKICNKRKLEWTSEYFS